MKWNVFFKRRRWRVFGKNIGKVCSILWWVLYWIIFMWRSRLIFVLMGLFLCGVLIMVK